MSWIATGIAWIKDAIRAASTDAFFAPHLPLQEVAEVDSERQRYSAKRYIEAQRRAMNGDYTGREEWASAIARMSDEDREAFFNEVDFRIFAGELVDVLTTEQMEEVRLNVLKRKDEIQADNRRAMTSFGEFDAAIVHAVAGDPDWQPEDNGLDEDGLPAWPADLGSEAWDEQRGESE